jgi:methylphosphonate synthase
MNTGDSCYITPFVPHSFTGRDEKAPALIIAVTYAGDVRRAISEIAQMGTSAVEIMAGDLRDISCYAQRLNSSLNAESLTSGDLKEHLFGNGIAADRSDGLAKGKVHPSPLELAMIAAYLNLRPMDLDVPSLQPSGEVSINYTAKTKFRTFPQGNNNGHQIKQLARTPLQPYLKAFDIRVSSGDNGEFCHGLHEYVYNYGERPIDVFWGKKEAHQDILQPGDSAYFQPMTGHRFKCAGGVDGSVVCVRIPGRLNNAALNEYASFPKTIRKRVAEETTRWF